MTSSVCCSRLDVPIPEMGLGHALPPWLAPGFTADPPTCPPPTHRRRQRRWWSSRVGFRKPRTPQKLFKSRWALSPGAGKAEAPGRGVV